MPQFDYSKNIPFATNNPSVDQPKMLRNTNSTEELIDVDHYSFNNKYGGTHKFVQLRNTDPGNGVIPAGLQGNGWETLYSSVKAGLGELWYVQGNVATGVQLTGPFVPQALQQGYAFISGGMLLQWGRVSSTSNSGTVNFVADGGIAFPNACFSVTISPKYTSSFGTPSQRTTYAIDTTSLSAAGFDWLQLPTGGIQFTGFFWMAVGN